MGVEGWAGTCPLRNPVVIPLPPPLPRRQATLEVPTLRGSSSGGSGSMATGAVSSALSSANVHAQFHGLLSGLDETMQRSRGGAALASHAARSGVDVGGSGAGSGLGAASRRPVGPGAPRSSVVMAGGARAGEEGACAPVRGP
jgi:hypothetical protein